MTIRSHQPWKPTRWVGGIEFGHALCAKDPWLGGGRERELESMPDDSRAKYAATKATAAILLVMRIKSE